MLPGHDIRYIRMEKVIMEYLDLVFDQYEVSDPNYICVTRNADVSPDDEALESPMISGNSCRVPCTNAAGWR